VKEFRPASAAPHKLLVCGGIQSSTALDCSADDVPTAHPQQPSPTHDKWNC